jgi:hypothetical protein
MPGFLAAGLRRSLAGCIENGELLAQGSHLSHAGDLALSMLARFSRRAIARALRAASPPGANLVARYSITACTSPVARYSSRLST